MTLLRFTPQDLLFQEQPLEMLKRVGEWHQIPVVLEDTPSGVVEARFPGDQEAQAFLLVLCHGDQKAALELWRNQP